MLKLAVVISVALSVQVFGSPAIISPALQSQLRSNNGQADVMVTLKASIQPLLSKLQSQSFLTRGQRLTTLAKTLKAHTWSSQKSLLSFLNQEASAVEVKSFWISNKVLIKNADAKLIQAIAARSDVAAITENKKIELIRPVSVSPAKAPLAAEIEWGLERIDVEAVWAKGINGTGVRIGGLDTGVRATHESIRDNFAKDYNWFDAAEGSLRPVDPHGHGTHITGTIVGKGGIGVAPGAEWIHCRGMDSAGSATADIFLACGEWFICPTRPDGSDPNCDKAPALVSNSWGFYGGEDDFMDDILTAWIAGGIAPIFANGNEGPTCGFMRSPGDTEVPIIAVGSTDVNNEVSSFSSFGPSYKGQIKPDIAAPGSNVRSAGNMGDSHYQTMSGTSMATPHVAGVVALMISAEPNITYEELRTRLFQSATHIIKSTGQNCGNVRESTYPNNHVGWGFLSASKAVKL